MFVLKHVESILVMMDGLQFLMYVKVIAGKYI